MPTRSRRACSSRDGSIKVGYFAEGERLVPGAIDQTLPVRIEHTVPVRLALKMT